MEFLNKIKELNHFLLKTWIPAGQNFEDKEIETRVMGIYESEAGKAEIEKWKEIGFTYTCTSDGTQSMSYNEEKWAAADPIAKEIGLNLYLMEELTGEPYSETMQIKFIREMQAKEGFTDL